MRGSLSGIRSRVDRLALKLGSPGADGCLSCRNQEETTRVCCIYGNEKPKMPMETRCPACGRLIPVHWVSVAYDINMKPADM